MTDHDGDWQGPRKVARTGAAVGRGAVGVWRWLWESYRSIGGSAFVMNVGIVIIATSCGLFVWWAAFDPVSPVISEEVVRIEPDTRVIDRDVNDDLNVVRRLCLSRSARATVRRSYVDGVIYQTPESAPVQFYKGCNERLRSLDVPSTLPPGRYVYRASLTFCNRVRCEEVWLHDIPIIIRGRFPVDPSGVPAPMREPL